MQNYITKKLSISMMKRNKGETKKKQLEIRDKKKT